jgi:hypothetical protein
VTGNVCGGDVEAFKALGFDCCFEGVVNVGGCYHPAIGTGGDEIRVSLGCLKRV